MLLLASVAAGMMGVKLPWHFGSQPPVPATPGSSAQLAYTQEPNSGESEAAVKNADPLAESPAAAVAPTDKSSADDRAADDRASADEKASADGTVAPRRVGWRDLARAGRFNDAFEQLEGEKPSNAGMSAEDLLLAADAARLSHHPKEAAHWLQTLVDRYPADTRVPVASFTLGRLLVDQLGQPRLAARAFARVVARGGTLAPDALAREAEALEAAGAHDEARSRARRYLESYPGGEHASAMRAIK
jgi:transmembrane sensor